MTTDERTDERTGAPPGPGGHEHRVAAVADQVGRQLRALHAFKAQAARGQDDVERAMHLVLYVLADTGPLRAGALAERLGTDPSTTSRQTAELVKRDLLRKLPDPADGRASLLDVTAAGHEVVTAFRQRRHEHLARALDGFTDAELDDFTALLSRFADGLERARTDGPRSTGSPQENA